jgi:CO dehydrogenase maturation factor
MGRGQGPECYCYPNVVLKKFIENLSAGYASLVMDNEAGMEHLSRKTTEDMDALLLVSNHTVKGVRAVARIKELVAELKLAFRQQLVIINLVPGALDPLITKEMEQLGLKADAVIPEDETLNRFDMEQKPLLGMPDDSVAVRAVDALMEKILSRIGTAQK